MNDLGIDETINELIDKRIIYYRHYIGEVVEVRSHAIGEAEKQIVQVKATIPELGFYTPDQGLWCFPRQSRSQVVPVVGDYVEVYFMNADAGRAVYLYPLSEVAGLGFTIRDLQREIIYQDKENTMSVEYNKSTSKLELGNGAELGAARMEDETTSTTVEDSTFWTWISAVAAALAVTPNLVVTAPAPTQLLSKITSASERTIIE